jgi:hypothetical protein
MTPVPIKTTLAAEMVKGMLEDYRLNAEKRLFNQLAIGISVSNFYFFVSWNSELYVGGRETPLPCLLRLPDPLNNFWVDMDAVLLWV